MKEIINSKPLEFEPIHLDEHFQTLVIISKLYPQYFLPYELLLYLFEINYNKEIIRYKYFGEYLSRIIYYKRDIYNKKQSYKYIWNDYSKLSKKNKLYK